MTKNEIILHNLSIGEGRVARVILRPSTKHIVQVLAYNTSNEITRDWHYVPRGTLEFTAAVNAAFKYLEG